MTAPAGFAATFFDGRTARPRDVVADVTAAGVRIREPGGPVLATWPPDAVRLAGGRRTDGPVRLCASDRGAARLTIRDAAAWPVLARCCPLLHRRAGGLRDNWKPLLLWGAGAIVSVVLLVTVAVPYLAAALARAVPAEAEAAWGDALADRVVAILAQRLGHGRDPEFCETPAGRAALDRLTARLTDGTPLPLPLTVRVLDLPVVNAFALPGGQIILFSGFIAEARGPEEIAGVLAHEIGHVVHRHPLEIAAEQIGLGAVLSLLVGDVSGGTLIVAGTQLLLLTSYSRGAEREADDVAVTLLNRADVAAAPMAAFFDRLAAREGETEATFSMISTHPLSRERAEAIRAAATGRGPAMPDADWQALRAMCDD